MTTLAKEAETLGAADGDAMTEMTTAQPRGLATRRAVYRTIACM